MVNTTPDFLGKRAKLSQEVKCGHFREGRDSGMLIGRTAVLALVLCLVLIGNSLAQAQRRSQHVRVKQPEATVTQPKSTEEQRGTEQSPFIVKVAPNPKTDDERAEEAKQRERIADSERKKEESDAKIVWFTAGLFGATVALVIATVVLGVVAFLQFRDIKASIRAAQESAEAAKKSAKLAEKSLFEAYRPHVTISPPELREANDSQETPHIHFGLTNIGKGAAIVKEVTATVQATNRGNNVLTLATNSEFVTSDDLIIESGEAIISNYITSSVLGQPELFQQIISGEKTLRIIFQISSQDIFGHPYPQTFPFIFDHEQQIFIRSNLLIPKKK